MYFFRMNDNIWAPVGLSDAWSADHGLEQYAPENNFGKQKFELLIIIRFPSNIET